jgi:hypothetical protein
MEIDMIIDGRAIYHVSYRCFTIWASYLPALYNTIKSSLGLNLDKAIKQIERLKKKNYC